MKEHGGQRRVEIEDTGLGVPPEIEETLFNPFVRAHGNDPGERVFGLATVRRLAQGHWRRSGLRPKPEGGLGLLVFELSVVSEAARPIP